MILRLCALGLLCLSIQHLSAAFAWQNPRNVEDPRFDSATGQLKANPKNDVSLELNSYRVPARRTSIVDRNGKFLAHDVAFPRPAIWLIGGHGADVLNTFESDLNKLEILLSREIEVEPLDLIFFEKRRGTPLVLNLQLSEEEVLRIEKAKIPRLRSVVASSRNYPLASIMAHAVGWSTALRGYSRTHLYNPIYGQSGMESLFNKELTPQSGTVDVLKDAQDHTLKAIRESPAEEASTLQVSLDSNLQKKLLKTLNNKIKKGALLVADALSGEVLVLLSLPSFDPNKLSPFEDINYKNKLLKDSAEPLSNRVYRKYQGIDLNDFKNSIRFKEDLDHLVNEANNNYAKLISEDSYDVKEKGITPLYLLALAQTLSYSAPLSLKATAAKKNLEDFEDLGPWNRVNYLASATREGRYVLNNSAYPQTHKALLYVGTTQDRKYNFVLISEDKNMNDNSLIEIKTLVENTLSI